MEGLLSTGPTPSSFIHGLPISQNWHPVIMDIIWTREILWTGEESLSNDINGGLDSFDLPSFVTGHL